MFLDSSQMARDKSYSIDHSLHVQAVSFRTGKTNHCKQIKDCLSNAMAPGALTTTTTATFPRSENGHSPSAKSASAALEAAIARFEARNPRSQALQHDALQSMPGGNTRAQMYTFPFPVVMKSGEGWSVTSEDGHV